MRTALGLSFLMAFAAHAQQGQPNIEAGKAKVAARLAADETMHWTLLNNALGKPLPTGGMPFGA